MAQKQNLTVLSNLSYQINTNLTQDHIEEYHFWSVPPVSKVTLCIIYTLIFLLGTFGNGSVIYTLGIKRRKTRKQGHELIVALAVTDFLSSIAMPFVMINDLASDFRWHLGEVGCIIFPGLNSIFLFASAWILAAISWERRR